MWILTTFLGRLKYSVRPELVVWFMVRQNKGAAR